MRTLRFLFGAGFSLLIAVSAWVPIPLSPGFVERRIEAAFPPALGIVATVGGARIRWGSGRLAVDDLTLRGRDGFSLVLDRLDLQAGLLPGTDGFLEPRSLVLHAPVVELDREFLEHLPSGGEALALPRLSLKVEQGRLTWTETDLPAPMEVRLPEFGGLLEPGGWKLHGTLGLPGGLTARAWIASRDGGVTWNLDLVGEAAPLDLEGAGIDFLATCRAEALSLRAHLEGGRNGLQAARVDGRLADLGGDFLGADLRCRGFHLDVSGSLDTAIALHAGGTFAGIPVEAEGSFLRNPAGDLRFRLRGTTEPVPIDASLLERIQDLDEGTAEAFRALELRGDLATGFVFRWDSGRPLRWVAHVPLQDSGSTYRGFLEDDGARPAFPYPIHGLGGDFTVAGLRALVDLHGFMGAGRFSTRGSMEFGDGPAGIHLDVGIEGLPVDEQVHEAARGVPGLLAIWEDLGVPRGGLLDLDIFLRRPLLASRVDVSMDGLLKECQFLPAFLPVRSHLLQTRLLWRPGLARFQGEVEALGTRVGFSGHLAEAEGEALPSVVVRISGADLKPARDEWPVLKDSLELPEFFSRLELSGPNRLEVFFRRPAGRPLPQVLARADLGGDLLVLHDPQSSESGRTLRFSRLVGLLSVARNEPWSSLAAPGIAGILSGNGFAASLVKVAGRGNHWNHFWGLAPDFEVTPELPGLVGALSPALEEDLAGFDLSGRLGFWASLDLDDSASLEGLLRLAPLALGGGPEDAPETTRLQGDVYFSGAGAHSRLLEIENPSGRLLLHDLSAAPSKEETRIHGRLETTEGIDLDDFFANLFSADAWAAFQRIGFRGRVRSPGLGVDFRLPSEGTPSFSATGELGITGLRMEGPPRLRNGSGTLAVSRFTWKGPEDFQAEMTLTGGQVRVNDLRTSNFHGEIHFDSREVVLHHFSADVLGGKVLTRGKDLKKRDEEGEIRMGLTPEAPLRILLHLQDLSLARMRDELNLGGSLDGRIGGRLDFRSATPDPLDYKGRGQLEIQGGVLGQVPVLSSMWRFAGVDPPQFKDGRLRFRSDPAKNRGWIRIDELVLDHPLLKVKGEGWVGLDGYLRMKATVRAISFLTGLPLIGDIFDLFVEQDVRGPISRPVISQRALGKISGSTKEQHPFPLWMPGVPSADWRLSPVLPVEKPPRKPE